MKEKKNLEFKSTITNTFLKTVSAYSNFGDGEIWFGINDDGSVCGIEHPEMVCIDIENRINDSISPKPEFEMKVDTSKNIICLTVREGAYKPYLYKGKAYRRSDTASIEVGQAELKRLVLEGSNLYFEELPSENGDRSKENQSGNKSGLYDWTHYAVSADLPAGRYVRVPAQRPAIK